MKGTFVFALLCLLLVGCGSTVSSVSETPTPTPTIHAQPTTHAALAPTATRAIPTPTPKPTMAPTAAPTATAAHPHLGDPITEWDIAYANTEQDVSSGHQKMHGYTFTVSGRDVKAVAAFDPAQGNRVVALSIEPVSGTFDATSMPELAIPLDFLPPDASTGNQTDGDTGLEWQFHSALLATQFPASYFLNNNGGTAPAGDCNVYYVYATGSKTEIERVTLTIGDVYGV